MRPNADRERVAWTAGLVAAAILLAFRLPHLRGPLDDPHSWRQCDTAFYSLDFFRHGIDLLRPMVCWLGARRPLIFELPLPEAMAALLYRALGPDPIWDRVVALLFFTISAAYLHAFARSVASARAAWLATLAYLAFPLGLFYSRAAHVDFAAIAFAHAFLFHAARAARRRSAAHAGLAALTGALAAMIKAPYLIPVLGPLALVVLARPGAAPFAYAGVPLAVVAVAFKLWRRHVDTVNAAVPDWSFLPGFYKEVNPLWWYVGSWSQRLELGTWIKLGRRLVLEALTPLGALLALGAAFAGAERREREAPALGHALAWLVATGVYLAVFFPLNVIHDYYQTPFLAPFALLVGLGANAAWERLPRIGARRFATGAIVFVAFAAAAVISTPALGFYRVDWLRVEAGRLIDRALPRTDLVVVADHNSGWSDPRLLVRADRQGWPLAIPDLEPARLARLAGLGARWVAVLTDVEHPDLRPPAFLEPERTARLDVRHDGRTLGTLSLYRLGPAPAPGKGTGPS